MPELPEVETTIKSLKLLINCKIINIKIHTPKLRLFIPKKVSMFLVLEMTKVKQNTKMELMKLKMKKL